MYMYQNGKSTKNKASLSEKGYVCAPPFFHKSVVELFEVLTKNFIKTRKTEFTISSFKSFLASRFGFSERKINLRFNLLKHLDIIGVYRQGKIKLNLEKLAEFSKSSRLKKIIESNQEVQRVQTQEELNKSANTEKVIPAGVSDV